MLGGDETEILGALRLSDFVRIDRVKRPYRWITVAMIISALAPAGILAYQIWDGKTYVEVTKRASSSLQGSIPREVK